MTTTTKNKSVQDRTLTYAGNLIKLLPTGTVLLFQFLNPVLTNNGNCTAVKRQQIPKRHSHHCFRLLLLLCLLHRQGSDGQTHYGVATSKGLCPSTSSVDLSAYKLRFGDFVHAFFSLIVFAVMSLLDANTVRCYYPGFEPTEKVLLQVLPRVIGTIAGTVFVVLLINAMELGTRRQVLILHRIRSRWLLKPLNYDSIHKTQSGKYSYYLRPWNRVPVSSSDSSQHSESAAS